MENADLKSQLKERDARIAKLETLASAKPHPSPRSRNGTRRSPDASRGLSTGGRPSACSTERNHRLPGRHSAHGDEVRSHGHSIVRGASAADFEGVRAGGDFGPTSSREDDAGCRTTRSAWEQMLGFPWRARDRPALCSPRCCGSSGARPSTRSLPFRTASAFLSG